MWAWCKIYSLLVSFPLASSTQWSRQTGVGQHLTDWGLHSLRWVVGLQRSLLPSEKTHGIQTYANQSGLKTHNCCLPCCFCHCEQWHWSDLSRAQAWVKCMEILGCPVNRIPLAASLLRSKGEQSSTFGIDLAAGTARRMLKLNPTALQSPLLVFPWGLFLKPFPWLDVATRQWRFEIGVFLLLDELPFQANELHLLKATGFEAPSFVVWGTLITIAVSISPEWLFLGLSLTGPMNCMLMSCLVS